MSMIIESLRRLYKTGRVEKSKLDSMLASQKITKKEYDYIMTGEEDE